MTDGVVPLFDVFGDLFGGAPDGEWVAPGRVNIIGEHTDYSDGFVLPVAIDRCSTVAARSRDDGVIRLTSVQLGDAPDVTIAELSPGPMEGWWAYAHGVAWALRGIDVDLRGADLVVDSTVPIGSGLSSSAALEVSIGRALIDLVGAVVDAKALALAAQRAEQQWTGTPCGIMDQMVSAAARVDHALMLDTRSLAAEHIPFDLDTRNLRLVVINTRVTHSHAEGEYADRVRECREAAALLGVAALRDSSAESVDAAADRLGPVLHRRARHVVTENSRVVAAATALRLGRLDDLGRLLAASHASLRDDFEVSVPELDAAVDAALSAGALGARMTGGGFGGSALAIVEADLIPELENSVRHSFAAAGFVEPETFVVRSADGARRRR